MTLSDRERLRLGWLCLVLLLLCACSDEGDRPIDGDKMASDGDGDSFDNDATDGDRDEVEEDGEAEEEREIDVEIDEEPGETFPPELQTPLFERGLILPPNSLPCTPVETGVPQNNCNHHGSTVTELADGTVAAVWYHGEYEKSLDSRIVWSRLVPGTTEWSPVEVLYDDPEHSDGNPAVWTREDGRLYVFVATLWEGSWDSVKLRMVTSDDDGANWSDPMFLREAYCWNARHRPLRLEDGRLLLPLYQECLALPVFMRSEDDFESHWEELYDATGESFLDHVGQIQPALIRLGGGGVAALTRDGTAAHRIQRMESFDGGESWTPSTPINLPNSGTSIDQVRLLDGHVVVVFNNSPTLRFPLTVALSLDEGRTFTAIRTVNDDCPEGGCSFHYPSIMQSKHDGTIWITYTHKRETIGWVHFNEAWLAQGGELSRFFCLPGEGCVDGTCYPVCDDGNCGDDRSCVAGVCRRVCPCEADESCDSGGYCAPIPAPNRVDVLCQGDWLER